jgi:adenylate cyclase class 2
MMCEHEVEIKAILLLSGDLDEMDRKIEVSEKDILGIGSVFQRKVEQMDIYLSHPSRDFSKTDEAFRIRVEDKRIVKLTYKGPKISERSKSRLEKEITLDIEDIDGLREIYSHLGFREVMSVIKERRIYHLEGVEIDLDKVTGLGVFCEMEILSDNIVEAEEKLIGILNKIGWTDLERRSYMELLLEKQF